jgi:transcription antitermination factor NusG
MQLTHLGAEASDSRVQSHTNAAAEWFAVRVQAGFERRVAVLLQEKGYESYVPTFQFRRKWSDRVKESAIPLFPGYLFCEFESVKRLPILMTPRVYGIAGVGKQPIPIAESEMAMVRSVVSEGLRVAPCPYLTAGQPVMIEHGPLAGVRGFLVDAKNELRVVVSIHLLQRSISTQVERDCVRPLGAETARVVQRG